MKRIKLENLGIDDHTKIVLKNNDRHLIYYKPNAEDGNGFKFKIVHNTVIENTVTEVIKNECEILFEGVAYFDGIRHLYIGNNLTDNKGYFYYPEVDVLIALLEVLRDLENEFCSNKD